MLASRGRHVPRLWSSRRLNGVSRGYATERAEPYRVLFCGADEFSIKSLEALHREHIADNDFIKSIDVVCRPPKRTGRGLKILRHAPIKAVAQRMQLPVHEIDTFTGWEPPVGDVGGPNLIIAVSFGLFVPRRILGAAIFGGVNVHPSLLPDLRGPAPIQHAIMKDRVQVGVTVQTLNHEKFDHGQILAQTLSKRPATRPTYLHGEAGLLYRTLAATLADDGAATLVETLRKVSLPPQPGTNPLQYHRNGTRVQPAQHHEPWPREPYMSSPEEAPKITPAERHLDWSNLKWRAICLRHGAAGQLWDESTYAQCHPQTLSKRIVFQELAPLDVTSKASQASGPDQAQPGQPSLFTKCDHGRYQWYSPTTDATAGDSSAQKDLVVGIATCDPKVPVVHVRRCTIEAAADGVGQEELKRLLLLRAAQSGESLD